MAGDPSARTHLGREALCGLAGWMVAAVVMTTFGTDSAELTCALMAVMALLAFASAVLFLQARRYLWALLSTGVVIATPAAVVGLSSWAAAP